MPISRELEALDLPRDCAFTLDGSRLGELDTAAAFTLCRHLAEHGCDEAMVATRAFERFWGAIKPERFGSFPHLASLLRYLKLCVFAALVDELRGRRSWQEHRAAGELADEVEGPRVDETVLDEVGRADLWSAIEVALPDQAERLVIYLSCVIGLKPREIARRHREVYSSVEEVYRAKRLALERLRRDNLIRSFWEAAG